LRNKIPSGLEEAVNGELATTQQIYDIIISDLERAIEILPEKFKQDIHPPSYQYGRANKYAAMALLTRVYFQMNEFDKAEQLCNNIINYAESTGYYSLDQDPIEAFNKAYGFEGEGTEVIWFYLQYEGDGVGSWKNQFIAERMSKCRRYGDNHAGRTLACSDYFLETVGWQDPSTKEPTEEAMADKRYNQLYHRYLANSELPEGYETPDDGVYETQFETNRPYVWGNKYYRDANDRLKTNIPILRLPEIYLTRAIIRLKGNDSSGAASDLNKVRESRGLEALGTVTEDDIHNERWKELNFEGDRITYLRALRENVPNGDRGTGSVEWNSSVWEWPVPARERELNNAYGN
jgi:starch-binding outer membrane protein, SusD/RagB family